MRADSSGRNSRRAFLQKVAGLGASVAGLSVLASCDRLASALGRPPRTYRIGAVFGSSPDAIAPMIAAFRDGLREYGYLEGQNIVMELRFAEGDGQRFPALLNEVVSLPVDLLFIPNATAVAVARQVTTTVPIVMTDVFEVVDAGLVSSLGRPGGNVTGLAIPPLEGKQLELLCGTLDRSSGGVRVAVLRVPTAISMSAMRKMMPSAEYLNVHVLTADIHSSEDIPVALEAASRAGADALFTFLSPLTLINMRSIVVCSPRMWG